MFARTVNISQSDVLAPTSDQKAPLGTKGYTPDGRVFRYAKNGATNLTTGRVVQSPAQITYWDHDLHPSCNYSVTTNSTAMWVTFRKISSGTLPTSANVVADGYLVVNNGTGEGQILEIASNTASTSTLANVNCKTKVVFKEGSRLHTTIANSSGWGASGGATGTQVGLIRNPYDDVIVNAKSEVGTGLILGVTITPVTANYYFWLQTGGPCVALMDTTSTAGYPIIRSATDAGAIRVMTTLAIGYRGPNLGRILAKTADTEFAPIVLAIDS